MQRAALDPPVWKPRSLCAAGIGLALAAAIALLFDLPITARVQQTELPGDIRRVIEFSEGFGHGLGVALIIFTIAFLEKSWRRFLFLATYAFGAGLVCDALKTVVARHRPYHGVNFQGEFGASFIGWFPWLHGESIQQATSSFPSAHTATAVGLALALAALYPRGRYLFLLYAALTGCQRITSYAHFTSDVLAGAALACFLAATLAQPWSFTRRLLAGEALPESDVETPPAARKCA